MAPMLGNAVSMGNSHLPSGLAPELHPRKTPSQARSGVTVTAILDATIQVLARDGLLRLTTTRVAERAGVSVGTLYQYFGGKRPLLAAVKQRHLAQIVEAVERACRDSHGAALREMMATLCSTFIDAKIRHVEESRALYAAGSEVDGDVLARAASQRAQQAIALMLHSASDRTIEHPEVAAMVVATAITGPVHALLESGAPAALVLLLRTQLTELCVGYGERIGKKRSVAASRRSNAADAQRADGRRAGQGRAPKLLISDTTDQPSRR